MGIKNDSWIAKMAYEQHMIEPWDVRHASGFTSDRMRQIISYGVSSYGYDMRVANEFKIFTNYWPGIIDPKAFSDSVKFHEVVSDDPIIIPPNSFALARSVEYFRIPITVMTIVIGKSTYARCGIIVNVTALEPGWEGNVTIEISNTTPLPSKIYPNEGIAQVLFFEADEVCNISYADKRGKYQGQTGITLPKV
jgi:dCTP deaminase